MADKSYPAWQLDQTWRDRLTGQRCELCELIKSDPVENSEGFKVADLRVTRWMLGRNQYIRGYSVLVLKHHATELFEISSKLRAEFIEDIATASEALQHLLFPIKINQEIQGNVIPHLHCHIKPRFSTDRPGHARIFQDAGRVVLTNDAYQEMIGQLQESIGESPSP